MNEKRSIICWIKAHKKQLIIAGFSIATLIALVLALKNRESIKALLESLQKAVESPASQATPSQLSVTPKMDTPDIVAKLSDDPTIQSEVRRHIRTLHEGWHASPEKIATALENNIILKEGQTWVDSYIKGANAA